MAGKNNMFMNGIAKLKNIFLHKKENTDIKKEIKNLIKNAKNIEVGVGKETIRGKRVAYMTYKIHFLVNKDKERGAWVDETLVVDNDLIIYLGHYFHDDEIIFMMKKRAQELSPARVADCEYQAKEWVRGSQTVSKGRER